MFDFGYQYFCVAHLYIYFLLSKVEPRTSRVYWSDIGKPDMVYHKSDYGLPNQMVLNRGQIRPGGKIHYKTNINMKIILHST